MTFDELGGTIGRADTNQLVLPDPERSVSRIHAQIVFRNGAYAIADRGSNPIQVNGKPLGQGKEQPLREGDRITIGGYELVASFVQKTVAKDPFADLFGAPASAPGAASPWDELLGPQGRAPAAPAAPKPLPVLTEGRHAASPAAPSTKSSPGGGIPDDWDPFADEPVAMPASLLAPSPQHPNTPDSRALDVPSPGDSLDALFGLGEDRAAPPSGGAQEVFQSRVNNTAGDPDPLRALLQPQAAAPPSVSDHASELNLPWPSAPRAPAAGSARPRGAVMSWDESRQDSKLITLPGVRRPDEAAVATSPEPLRGPVDFDAPAARPSQVSSTASPDTLARALLEGLSAPGLRLQPLDESQMRLIGQLLREATAGSLHLLTVRAALKREMRSDVTMIVAKENNPLKFSPTPEVALQHLLGPPTPGFMSPTRAMRDAYDDLRAHQLGVTAGMKAALEGVLRRFEPALLEARLGKRSGLTALLPGARNARLWELFQELYEQLSKEATEDFAQLFGQAFLRAYEAHVAELEREP